MRTSLPSCLRSPGPPLLPILCLAIAVLIQTSFAAQAQAAELQGSPATYRSIVRLLQPGDDLTLESGVYRQGLSLHGLQGTHGRPIRIHGPTDGAPAVFIGRTGHNTISLSNTAHVHISSLVLDGRDLEVDAVKAEGSKDCSYVHHIVLQDLLIVGHGIDQQVVGISSMCPAWNWVIRRNVIVGAGTGFYLGNSDGSAPFVGGLIEQNLIIDSRGYNLQIKHQNERPAGIGMPPQQTRTVIRHNLFTKARNASSAMHARPNILLGHFPRQGAGSEDDYEVTNNLFFCNPGESLLQAEGNLSLAGNLFVNPAGDAVSIQPHHDVPRRVSVHRNFIAASGLGVSVSQASPLHPQAVADNWLFSPAPLKGGKQHGNRIAPFPAPKAAFIQWLRTERASSPRFEDFAPLVLSANRICSGQVDGYLPDPARSQYQLRSHPVCNLVELLATSLGKPLPGSTESEPFMDSTCSGGTPRGS